MDLSKLSDDDLVALKNKEVSKLSDDGLKYIKEQYSSQAPKQSIPEVESKPTAQPASSDQLDQYDKPVDDYGISDDQTAAGLTGIAQGATFGFSDELGAGLDVAKDYLTNNPKAKTYREYQKLREAANKKLEEEHPIAYGVGNLVGGLGSSVIIPGSGGSKLLAGVKSIAPIVDTFLSGKAASTLGRIGGKALAMGIESTPVAALYGAGTSENTLEGSPTELAKDVTSNAATGNLMGMALGGLAATGSSLKSYVGDKLANKDSIRQLVSAYNYGKQGIRLGNSDVTDQLSLIPGQSAKDLSDNILNAKQYVGQKMGDALDEASKNGLTITLDPNFQSMGTQLTNELVQDPTLMQTLNGSEKDAILSAAKQGFTNLDPSDAAELKGIFYNLGSDLSKSKSIMSPYAQKASQQLSNNLDVTLRSQITPYGKAVDNYEEFMRLVPNTIMSKATPAEYDPKFWGDYKDAATNLLNSSKEMLSGGQLSGTGAGAERATLETLRQNLNKLQQSQPNTSTVLGFGKSGPEYAQSLKSKSDELAMIRQSMGMHPNQEPDFLTGAYEAGSKLITGSKAPTIGLANLAGTTAQSAPVKVMSKVATMTDNGVMQIAQQLKAIPGLGSIGTNLEKAIQNKDAVAKDAILHRMMQDPNFRKLFSSGEEDSKEQSEITNSSNGYGGYSQ